MTNFASISKAFIVSAIAPFDCGDVKIAEADWKWHVADNGAIYMLPDVLDDIETLDATGSDTYSEPLPVYDFGLVATFIGLLYLSKFGYFEDNTNNTLFLFIDFLIKSGDFDYITGLAQTFVDVSDNTTPCFIHDFVEDGEEHLIVCHNPEYDTICRNNTLALTVETQETQETQEDEGHLMVA